MNKNKKCMKWFIKTDIAAPCTPYIGIINHAPIKLEMTPRVADRLVQFKWPSIVNWEEINCPIA